MDKSDAIVLQFIAQLPHVSFHQLTPDMDQRIETEREVDRSIGNHYQAPPVINVIA